MDKIEKVEREEGDIESELERLEREKKELQEKEEELKNRKKENDSLRYRYNPEAPKTPASPSKQVVQKEATTNNDASLFQPMTVNAL